MDIKNIKCENLSGIYSELANLIGTDAAKIIHENYRGQQVTFPVEFFSKQFTKSRIIAEYNGHNVKQLATRYGFSEKTIRKIIKENIDNP